jgi:hypothetical protein
MHRALLHGLRNVSQLVGRGLRCQDDDGAVRWPLGERVRRDEDALAGTEAAATVCGEPPGCGHHVTGSW